MKPHWIAVVATWAAVAGADSAPYHRLEELSRAKDFATFIDDTRAVSLYKDELRKYFGDDNFSCENFETVLGDFRTLKAKVAAFENRAWASAVSYPTFEIALSDEETAFTVRPLRAFHAIWFDTKANGCGQTACELADPNAPERWAAVLERGQLFAVEKKGRFTGTVYLLVPVQDKSGAWAGIWVRESGTVPPELADAWLEKLRPSLPKEWKGVRRRLAETRPLDPIANKIAKALPRKCFSANESRGENLLAGLDTRAADGNTGFIVDFKNPEAVSQLMDTFQSPDAPGKLAELSPRQFQDLKQNLGGVLFSNDSLAKRARAAQALGWLAQPVKRVDLPEMKVSGTTFSPRLPSSQITPLLSRALQDASPLVRGAAAVNLADLGVQTPAVNKAQQDILNGAVAPLLRRAPKGGAGMETNDPNLLGRAAENALRNGTPLKRGQLDRLFDSAEKLPPGKDQERLVNAMARAYLGDSNPARALQFSHDNFAKNPAFMQKVADKVNSLSCPKRDAYEKGVRELLDSNG